MQYIFIPTMAAIFYIVSLKCVCPILACSYHPSTPFRMTEVLLRMSG